jgi:hypothetical protein
MTKKEKSVSVEFLVNHVCWLNGKRTFCNSNPMKDKKGAPLPRKKYNIPISYYEHYLSKGWIKKLKVNPIKKKVVAKKPVKKVAKKAVKKPVKKKS